jgi:hypothetical protein
MKIIAVDNFDRETVDDWLVAEGIKNEEMAKVMCQALVDKYCTANDSPTFYRVVKDDYELRTFQP